MCFCFVTAVIVPFKLFEFDFPPLRPSNQSYIVTLYTLSKCCDAAVIVKIVHFTVICCVNTMEMWVKPQVKWVRVPFQRRMV